VPYTNRDNSSSADLLRAAYAWAKDHSAQEGSVTAAYDAVRAKFTAAVQQAGFGTDAATDGTEDEDDEQERAMNPPEVKKAEAGPSDLPAAEINKLLDRLTLAFETRLAKAGAVTAEEVKALCKMAVDNMPAQVIEVRREGDLIASVKGVQHKLFPVLLKAISTRQSDGFFPSVWMSGPAGSGKTYAAKKSAEAFGRSHEFNGALSMSHEVLGYQDAAGVYHDTPFRRGYSSACHYLFDECDGCADNAPLLALNAALANGIASFPDRQVVRHPDSVIMAGANTFGLGATADYVGRARIDAAFLDRFAVKINWDYDEELELAICGNEDWCREVQRARAQARRNGLKVLITPRASMAGAALIRAGFTIKEAKALTYQGMLTTEQKQLVG
jgi:cobaltochelatase CobS